MKPSLQLILLAKASTWLQLLQAATRKGSEEHLVPAISATHTSKTSTLACVLEIDEGQNSQL